MRENDLIRAGPPSAEDQTVRGGEVSAGVETVALCEGSGEKRVSVMRLEEGEGEGERVTQDLGLGLRIRGRSYG